jgi:hypothetical protein
MCERGLRPALQSASTGCRCHVQMAHQRVPARRHCGAPGMAAITHQVGERGVSPATQITPSARVEDCRQRSKWADPTLWPRFKRRRHGRGQARSRLFRSASAPGERLNHADERDADHHTGGGSRSGDDFDGASPIHPSAFDPSSSPPPLSRRRRPSTYEMAVASIAPSLCWCRRSTALLPPAI